MLLKRNRNSITMSQVETHMGSVGNRAKEFEYRSATMPEKRMQDRGVLNHYSMIIQTVTIKLRRKIQ